MRHILLATLVATSLTTAPAWAQTQNAPRVLTLAFDADGRVNLKAQSVTIREILAEWARQCGCYIVNAQSISGGPLTVPFQFEHATQRQVLESLLRQVSGYTLTPKRPGSTSISLYETIHITPTSVATQTAYTAPIMSSTPDDEIPPVVPSPLRVDPNGGQAPPPPQQGQQQPAGSQPQQPAAPRVGTGSVFVPIVPIGGGTTGPTPGSTSQPARPGAPAAPGTPTGR
jgi:hypothetical protein